MRFCTLYLGNTQRYSISDLFAVAKAVVSLARADRKPLDCPMIPDTKSLHKIAVTTARHPTFNETFFRVDKRRSGRPSFQKLPS